MDNKTFQIKLMEIIETTQDTDELILVLLTEAHKMLESLLQSE